MTALQLTFATLKTGKLVSRWTCCSRSAFFWEKAWTTSAMVQECKNRPEGMSVDEWCHANNITKANYYYRLTQVRKACLESLPAETVEQAIVPVPMELMQVKPELSAPIPVSSNKEDSYLELVFHGVTVHVTEQTSNALLTKVLGVLAHVEWCHLF